MFPEAKERVRGVIKDVLPHTPRVLLAAVGATAIMALENLTIPSIAEAGGDGRTCILGPESDLPPDPNGRIICREEYLWSQVPESAKLPITIGGGLIIGGAIAGTAYVMSRRGAHGGPNLQA